MTSVDIVPYKTNQSAIKTSVTAYLEKAADYFQVLITVLIIYLMKMTR